MDRQSDEELRQDLCKVAELDRMPMLLPEDEASLEDIDLLVAWDEGPITHVVMLEAKGDSPWSTSQMNSKSARLEQIFGTNGDGFPHVTPHFGLMSPRPPQRISTKSWPRIRKLWSI